MVRIIFAQNISLINKEPSSNEWSPNPNILPDRFNSMSKPIAGGVINIGAETSTPKILETITEMSANE